MSEKDNEMFVFIIHKRGFRMYLILFCCVIVLFFISYYCFDKDILQPPVFLLLFYSSGIFAGFYLYDYWQLDQFKVLTVQIILLGLFSFTFGSLIAKFNKVKYKFKGKSLFSNQGMLLDRVEIGNGTFFSMIIVTFVVLLLFLSFFNSIVSGQQLANIVLEYKMARIEDGENTPFYLNFLIKLICSIASINLLILINNLLANKIKIKDMFLTIPIFGYIIISIFSANRGNILLLIFLGFCGWYILYHRFFGWSKNITSIVLRKGIFLASITAALFWLFVIITRDLDLFTGFDIFLSYICAYFAGSLASLNLYIREGGTSAIWWGEETFVALNNNLVTLFGIGHVSQRFLEFRSAYGVSVVNIYSSFRRFYHDFGFWGVAILSFLQGYITTRLYCIVKSVKSCGIDLTLVVYSFFFYTVPYILIDDLFWSSNISLSGLTKLWILIATYQCIFFNTKSINRKKIN